MKADYVGFFPPLPLTAENFHTPLMCVKTDISTS